MKWLRRVLGRPTPDEARELLDESRVAAARAFEAGQFRLAECELRRAHALSADLGPEEIARSTLELACVLVELDGYDEGLALCETALRVRRASLLAPHAGIAECLTLKGKILIALARSAEALPVVSEALAQREQLVKGDDPSLADDLSSLAALALSRGEVGEADRHVRRAVGLFGADSRDRRQFRPLVVLVETLVARRAADEQARVMRRIVERVNVLVGPEHPWRARAFTYYALDPAASGRVDALEEALALVARVLGKRHTLYASVLLSGGALGIGESRSKLMLEEALEIYTSVFGADHPANAWVLLCLGRLLDAYSFRGFQGEAEVCLRDALAVAEGTWGPQHTYLQFFCEALAFCLGNAGSKAAETFYTRALEIRERDHSPNDPSVIALIQARAGFRKATGDPAGALQDLARLRAWHEKQKPQSLEVGADLHEESEAFEALGDLKRALAVQRRAVAMLEDHAPEHASTVAALERLAVLLERSGDEPGARDARIREAEITAMLGDSPAGTT